MRALLAAFVLAVPALVQAQVISTGPVPTGALLKFEMPTNIADTTTALTFTARLSKDGTPLTEATQSSGMTCASGTAGITCQWTFTQSNLDALNLVGVHQLTLKLFRQDVGESQASAPFTLTSPAGAPTGLRITK